MASLPHDVWMHIAQFIPALAIPDLLSLNSTFFNLAMDCRYRQMSFAYLDNRMVRNLARLKDPVVARRVRVLHVYPGFLKQIRDRENASSLSNRPFRLRLTQLANTFEQKILVKYRKFRSTRAFHTPEDVVQAMFDVFAGLPNVTDYHIMWFGLPTVPESPVPFLAAVFQPTLRTLSLEISLENVESLLTPSCTILNLQELSLVLRIDHFQLAPDHPHILIHYLAPAISRLCSSLRKLSIQTWEPLDLSPLFHSIHLLPHLEHLTLSIPIEAPHLGDPSGLTALLRRQYTTLRSLSLRATQHSGAGLTPNSASLDDWIRAAITNVHLPYLRELDLSSALFPFPATLTCLEQFAGTITVLGMTGRYHSFEDVGAVVKMFSGRRLEERLERLRLGSLTLTPQLVDLLAREMPQLDRLELLIREICPRNNDYVMEWTASVDYQIEEFFSEMEKRSYACWRLRRLTMVLTSLTYRLRTEPDLEHHLVQLFTRCVPAVQWFS